MLKLMLNEKFFLTSVDFTSFVKACIAKKWVLGLKLFLNNQFIQFFYTWFDSEMQKTMMQDMIAMVENSGD